MLTFSTWVVGMKINIALYFYIHRCIPWTVGMYFELYVMYKWVIFHFWVTPMVGRLRVFFGFFAFGFGKNQKNPKKRCAILYLGAFMSNLINVDIGIMQCCGTQCVKSCQRMILRDTVLFSLTTETGIRLRGSSFWVNIMSLTPWWRTSEMDLYVKYTLFHLP